MKHYYQPKQGSYAMLLLLLLLCVLPTHIAQATTYTEDFETCKGNEDQVTALPDGWSYIGYLGYFGISTRYYHSSRHCITYTSGGNTSDYLVSPAVSGKVSLWIYGTSSNARYEGSIAIYECDDTGGKLAVGQQLGSFKPERGSWSEVSLQLSGSKRLAILMSRTAIDDFTATNDGNGEPPVVEERKALALTAFERTSDYAVTANEQNEFTATFTVTAKNTGNVGLAPDEVSVSITDEEGNAVATATALDSLAADSSVVVPVELTMNAGEGGTYYFYARENLTGTYLNNIAGTSIYRIVSVTAYRPQFALYVPGANASIDSDEQFDFGFSKTPVTQTFTLRNAGTAPLQVNSISVPDGFAVAPEGAFQVGAGGDQTISISLVPAEGHYGQMQGSVSIDHTLGTFSFGVRGVAVDPSLFFVSFDDGQFPPSWEVGENWTIMSQSARQQDFEGKATRLITQKLTVAEGESLTLQARRNYSSDDALLNIYYSPDKSEDSWKLAASLGSRIASSVFQTLTVSTIPAGGYYLAIEGNSVCIDNVLGYREASDVPQLSIACNGTTLKNGDSIDFGFTDHDSIASLIVMNAGTGILRSTLEISGEGFTVSPQTVGLQAGEQQAVSITMPVSPFGLHEGMLTIRSSELEDFTLTLRGQTRDPQMLYADFQDRELPRGWQAEGKWSVMTEDFGSTNYLAEVIEYNGQPQNLTTAKVRIAQGDVLTFDARRYSAAEYYAPVLRISYSPDRTNWTEAANLTSQLTTEWAQQQVDHLPAGDYYLRFEGVNIQIDNVTGVHIASSNEHIIAVTSFSVPTNAEVNHRQTISVAVRNLWAESENVSARLLIDGEELLTAQAQAITLNSEGIFSFEFTPRQAQEAVKAQVELTYADGILLTEEKTFTIAPESDETYAHLVSGVATDELEQPLAGVYITLTSNTEDAIYEGITADDGTFTIKVWQGILTYTLTATKQGYDDAAKQVIAFGGEDATGLTLVLVNQNPTPSGMTDARTSHKAKNTDFIDISGRKTVRPHRGIYVQGGRKIIKTR